MSSCHNLWSLWPNHNIHQPGPRFPWNKGTSLPKSYLLGEIGGVRSIQFDSLSQKIMDRIPFKLPLVLLFSKTKNNIPTKIIIAPCHLSIDRILSEVVPQGISRSGRKEGFRLDFLGFFPAEQNDDVAVTFFRDGYLVGWLNQSLLKNITCQKWIMKPRVRGENKRYLKPPPSYTCDHFEEPKSDLQRYIKFGHDLNHLVGFWLLEVVTLCVKDGWIRYTDTWFFTKKMCCLKIRLCNIRMLGSCDMPSTCLSPKKA